MAMRDPGRLLGSLSLAIWLQVENGCHTLPSGHLPSGPALSKGFLFPRLEASWLLEQAHARPWMISRSTHWSRQPSKHLAWRPLEMNRSLKQSLHLLRLPAVRNEEISALGWSEFKCRPGLAEPLARRALHQLELAWRGKVYNRSEERRVGKECRSEWWRGACEKKKGVLEGRV